MWCWLEQKCSVVVGIPLSLTLLGLLRAGRSSSTTIPRSNKTVLPRQPETRSYKIGKREDDGSRRLMRPNVDVRTRGGSQYPDEVTACCFRPFVINCRSRMVAPAEKSGDKLHGLWDWELNCWIKKIVMFWERKCSGRRNWCRIREQWSQLCNQIRASALVAEDASDEMNTLNSFSHK